MLTAAELRPGMVVRLEGDLYKVVIADHHAGAGKMGGVTHAKLTHLAKGTVRELRLRPDEKVEDLQPERQNMQFLYSDANLSYFMNPDSFEQVPMENQRLGAAAPYLRPEMTVPVEFVEGKPVALVFPEIVEARVQETAAPMHAAGSDNVWKKAILENGVALQVPQFIAPGDLVRVQVETGDYVERVREDKKK